MMQEYFYATLWGWCSVLNKLTLLKPKSVIRY